MAIKLPSYLYRSRHGIFYLRITPPSDLRLLHGLKEARISLNTHDRAIAVLSARELIIQLDAYWKALRQLKEEEKKPKSNELLLRLQEWRQRQYLRDKLDNQERDFSDERDRLLAELQAAKKSLSESKRDAATKGYLTGLRVGAERAGTTPKATPMTTPLFSAVATSHVQFKLTKKEWRPKTLEENKAIYDLFIEIHGDLAIGDIDRDASTRHLATLQQLPANRTKLYPGKSIADIVALKPAPMSKRSINKHMERLSGVFKWAMGDKKYGVTHNPFASMGIEETDAKEREPFTSDELLLLFSGKPFANNKFNTNYSFWLMPLALYTGARLNELCQIFLADIIEIEGLPCISITDEEESQRVKNKNAKRIVPIHSRLIEIGLLRYVKKLKEAGEKQLFPEIEARRDGFGATPSKWFGRYKEACGIHEKGIKVFHSFRHTFISTLLDSGVSEHLIAPIVGHEGTLITSKVYWNKPDATKRKPIIEKFQLPEEIEILVPVFESAVFSTRPGPK